MIKASLSCKDFSRLCYFLDTHPYIIVHSIGFILLTVILFYTSFTFIQFLQSKYLKLYEFNYLNSIQCMIILIGFSFPIMYQYPVLSWYMLHITDSQMLGMTIALIIIIFLIDFYHRIDKCNYYLIVNI